MKQDVETNPARVIGKLLVESGVSLEEDFEQNIERLAAYCDAPMADDALSDCESVLEVLIESCQESGIGLRIYVDCGVARVIPGDPLQNWTSPGLEFELGRL